MLKIEDGTVVSAFWSRWRLWRFVALETAKDARRLSLNARNVAAVSRALKLSSAFAFKELTRAYERGRARGRERSQCSLSPVLSLAVSQSVARPLSYMYVSVWRLSPSSHLVRLLPSSDLRASGRRERASVNLSPTLRGCYEQQSSFQPTYRLSRRVILARSAGSSSRLEFSIHLRPPSEPARNECAVRFQWFH